MCLCQWSGINVNTRIRYNRIRILLIVWTASHPHPAILQSWIRIRSISTRICLVSYPHPVFLSGFSSLSEPISFFFFLWRLKKKAYEYIIKILRSLFTWRTSLRIQVGVDRIWIQPPRTDQTVKKNRGRSSMKKNPDPTKKNWSASLSEGVWRDVRYSNAHGTYIRW